MNYQLVKDVIGLLQEFETENGKDHRFETSVSGFKNWILASNQYAISEPDWEGKENGRSAESIINTLFLHLNRYAKSYAKSAIFGSDFSTQEDFIYLITLKAFGEMTKMELIKKNVHEKPVGMQIINRLITQGWVSQSNSKTDKRSKVLRLNNRGLKTLELQMLKIRKASEIVTGDLTYSEKMELIRLLKKLDDFHHPIYSQNIEPEYLLDEAIKPKN